MCWRLSTDSDPATNPRASAEIHKARWTSEAEFQCKGSATGRRGETCVLQPPNIFPEWPREASDERWNFSEPQSPIILTSPDRNVATDIRKDPRRNMRGERERSSRSECRLRGVGVGGVEYVCLFLFRKSRKAPREVWKCHKSSHNHKHSFKK